MYKWLRDKYKQHNKPDDKNNKYKKKYPETKGIKVQVHKLFARHIPLKEQQEALAAEVEQGQQVINVYIGMPGRIRSLAAAGSIKLTSKKLKAIVFDLKANKKNFTMFETHETRDDAYAVLNYARKQLMRRKTRVHLIK